MGVCINTVQPIRDRQKLEDLKEELKKKGTRDYMLFYTGINSGMRISDIVKLTKDDIRNLDGTIKQHITVTEKKTGKQKRFPLCNGLLTEMERYASRGIFI
jgi:integrase